MPLAPATPRRSKVFASPAASSPPTQLPTSPPTPHPNLRNPGPPFPRRPSPVPVRFSQADASMGSREWLGSVTLRGVRKALPPSVLVNSAWGSGGRVRGSWLRFGCPESLESIRFSQA